MAVDVWRRTSGPVGGKAPIMPNVNFLEADLAALVVIDVQEKMLAAITSSSPEQIIDKIRRLIGVASLLEIPILYTEQYPQGLGPTDLKVRKLLAEHDPIVKTTCSCWRNETFRTALQQTEREHVVVAGLETHVCIQQTVLDLIRVDYVPFIPADAVGSRFPGDTDTALSRIRRAGAEVSTTESILFELIERCDHPKFKDFLKLVK
ncbi:MAG: hydrolase [Phycisphaerales bacterium]|nr:hydrolase [Phycisphaerales bacterium]